MSEDVETLSLGASAADIERKPKRAMKGGRVIIEKVVPELDGGRHPVKVVVGDIVTVEADIFTDGHEKIACAVKWRPEDQPEWNTVPMVFRGNDRWAASFLPSANIHHLYTVEAWRDPFASLFDGIVKKRAAGQTLVVESAEAVGLVAEAEARGEDRDALKALVARLHEAEPASAEQLDAICEPATRSRPMTSCCSWSTARRRSSRPGTSCSRAPAPTAPIATAPSAT